MSSEVSRATQGSHRRKRRRISNPYPPTTGRGYERRPMASGLRSRRYVYVRSNSDELVSSRLTRRPLSVSSSSSGNDDLSSDGSVVDLTDDVRAPSTSDRTSVVIIDSDEEVFEMEIPTPPTRRHTNHSSRKNQSTRSSSKSGERSEPKTPTKQTSKGDHPPKPSPGNEASKRIINCPVCMETVQQFEKDGRQLMVTRCGHIFCNVCITKALRAQRKCPNCRKPVRMDTGFHPLFLS